jgi:hypothetical protein
VKPGDLVQFSLNRMLGINEVGLVIRSIPNGDFSWHLIEVLFPRGLLRCRPADIEVIS